MAWWNRANGRHRAEVIGPRFSEGVTASAQHFDLDNEGDRKRLAKLQQQWQTDVGVYVDIIGELKDSARFIENSFRRIRLYAGWRVESDEELVPVGDAVESAASAPDEKALGEEATTDPADVIPKEWADAAEQIIDGFAARDGGQSALMARLGTGIFLIGEAIIVQRGVLERRPTKDEDPASIARVWDWEVRSPWEIREDPNDGKRLVTVDTPDARDGVPIVGVNEDPAYVERIWRKHWQWSGWADSNTRAAADTLEELRLLGLVGRASLRSRAMAGVWTIPDELDFGAADQAGDTGGATKTPQFDRSFADAIASSIGNEGDAASVAPTIVRGKAEHLKRDVFGPIEMPRRYGADERAQREDAVQRLGRTLELPQERMEGVSGVNHWTAWQIPEDAYRSYIEPLVTVVTEGLTFGLLRPMLELEGCPPEILDRIAVGGDASQLIQRVDKGKVASEGVANDSLSWEAWRRSNGFGDDDAASLEEQAIRGALKARSSPLLAAILLEQAGAVPPGTADRVEAMTTRTGGAGGDGQPKDGQPDGENGPPADQPDASTASAVARASRPGVGHRLQTIDVNLRERLLVLCDAAVNRALERAGGRLRTQARAASAAPEVRAAVAAAKDVTNGRLGQAVGPAVVASVLGPDPIGDDDFADLHDRFDRWTATAQTAALAELATLAGQRLTDTELIRLRTQQAADRQAAWDHLLTSLVGYAGWRLSAAEDDEERTGEWEPTATVRPGLLRTVLAIAGGVAIAATARGGVERANGGAVGGPATGDTMTQAFAAHGFPTTGYMWEYGSSPRATPYEDHLRLDGVEFADWDDPVLEGNEPGDHPNCSCDYVPVISEAVEDDGQASDEGNPDSGDAGA